MKKKLITGLIAAALLLQPYAAGAESAPLVYRVTDAEGHALYLLGTIHVGNDDMYPLGGAVEEAYQNADIVAVELDVYAYGGNLFSTIKTAFALMYGAQDNIKNHLSPETYALGVKALGMPEIALQRMKPAMWYSLAENYIIAKAGLDAMKGVDYWLLKQAHKDGKQIDELETLEEQMATLLAIPEDVIDYEVQAMLTYPEESAQGLLTLFEAWRQGDEKGLRTLLEASTEGEEDLSDAYAEYSDTLIDSRNDGFEEQALTYLNSGKTALIAVGAFHIIGENGLAEKLARAGFTVEEIGR